MDAINIESLQSQSQIKELWAKSCPTFPLPSYKCLAIRDLARVTQSGSISLPRFTDGLIRKAMAAASVNRLAIPDKSSKTVSLMNASTDAIPAGSKLVRRWNGVNYTVIKLDRDRYEFEGREYKSLTSISKKITGAHWSGPRFFGVNAIIKKKR